MFNWFKNKIELKNEDCIMTTMQNKKSFKIGSEIIVPDNFECLIYHKNKLFNTLNSGKYKLDKSTFSTLIDNQQTLKSKTKYIKFISHYVCMSKQELSFKFKKQKFTITFHIDNSSKFAELMLLYTYKVDNNYVYTYLIDIFKETLVHYQGKYAKITPNALCNYGISIDNLSPSGEKNSIFNNKSFQSIDSTQTKNIDEKSDTKPTKQSSNENNVSNNNLDEKQLYQIPSTNIQTNFSTCPKCGNSVKFKTSYCLRCGYKFND